MMALIPELCFTTRLATETSATVRKDLDAIKPMPQERQLAMTKFLANVKGMC